MKQIFFWIFLLLFNYRLTFSSAKDNKKNADVVTRSRQVSFSADTKNYDGKLDWNHRFIYPGRVAVDLSDTDSDDDLSIFAFSLHIKNNDDISMQKLEVIEPKNSLSQELLARWEDERGKRNNVPKEVQSLPDLIYEKDGKN